MPFLIHALIRLPEPLSGFREALHLTGLAAGGGTPELFVFREIGAVAVFVESVTASPLQAELLGYADVVERVAALATMLPVRYGSTAASEEALLAMLSANHDPIVEALDRVEGRVEYSVRILPPKEPSRIAGESGSDAVASTPPLLVGESVYKQYLRAKYEAFRKDRLLAEEAEALRGCLTDAIRRLDPAMRFASLDSAGFMVDLAVLVHRSAQAGFGSVFEAFRATHPDRQLLVTGPWPPYNFANLTKA